MRILTKALSAAAESGNIFALEYLFTRIDKSSPLTTMEDILSEVLSTAAFSCQMNVIKWLEATYNNHSMKLSNKALDDILFSVSKRSFKDDYLDIMKWAINKGANIFNFDVRLSKKIHCNIDNCEYDHDH